MSTFVNIASLDAECFQKTNAPGVTRLLGVISRGIVGSWPNPAVINSDNEITALPVLGKDKNNQDVKFVEYLFPKNTCNVDSQCDGDAAYQNYKHMINFNLAGVEKFVRAEAKKHLNAGTVWIAQLKGDVFVVVGSSDDPVFLKGGFKSGKGGKDKRGYEFKGEADAMDWDLPVIPAALMATLPVVSVLDNAPVTP